MAKPLSINSLKIKSLFKILFIFVYFTNSISYSITTNHRLNSDVNGGANSMVVGDLEAVTPITDPELKNYFITMEDFAQRLEQDKVRNSESIFGLNHQRVEVLNRTYALDQGQIEIAKPPVTSLNYSFDSQNKEFIIEGISGSDEKGLNGKVIARHIFSGFDVASVVADNLLVIIIEKNGKISAIPKSMVVHFGFEAPIPVFKNVNGSPLKFNDVTKVKSEFLTLASAPLLKEEVSSEEALAKEYEAGQLLVWEQNNSGERSNLVRLPTISLLNFVNVGLRYLNAASQLVTLDQKNTKELESVLKDLYDKYDMEAFEVLRKNMSPIETSVLSKYSPEKILKSLTIANTLEEATNSPRDKFTMSEWVSEHKLLHVNAQKEFEQKTKEAKEKSEKKASLLKKIFKLDKNIQFVDPDDFYPNNSNYQKFLQKNESPLQFKKSNYQVYKENVNKFLKSKAVTFLMIGAPVLAFYSLPYFYDKNETLQQIKSLSFMYENIIPEVLKDHAYRTPLIISTVIQIAIIPLVYLSAWGYKNIIKALAFSYKNSGSPFALKVKDFAAKYRDLTTTQVLLTINVRFFSMIIAPYWKVLIEGLLGQRTFFSAAKKGLNPFKYISKDSETGKLLNLEKSGFVGIGRPSYTRAQQNNEINLKIQQLLSEQKRSIEMAAWLLATKAISEKYELDPASLFLVAENQQVSSQEISKILSDPDLKKRWELLSAKLINEFKTLDTFSVVNLKKGLTKEQFAKLYEAAKIAAEKLNELPKYKIELKTRYLQFKKGLAFLKNWAVNLGDKESTFLKQVIPGKFVSQQVNQDFPVDQAIMTVLPGIAGDQADLKNPTYLAADAKKMTFTSDAQMYSIVGNVYGHLVSSAATLSLLNDSVKEEEETRYNPREYTKIVNNEWSPSFYKTSKSWFLHALNPLKSDVGGLAVQRYISRMNTIFASITFNLVSRVLISGQSMASSFKSFAIGFLASHRIFGFPWDFIQVGNRHLGEDAEIRSHNFKSMQYKISQGLRERDVEKSERLIDEAFSEIIDAYIKQNPKAIKELLNELNDVFVAQELQEKISKIDFKNLSPESLKYLGLFSQLVVAKNTENKELFEKVRKSLEALYESNNEIDSMELKKLNAEGLLFLTQTSPPVPTKENAIVTWTASILFGAILTTILSTKLAPLLMDPSYLAKPTVVWDSFLTCLKFTGVYYLVLGKKPWEFYTKLYKNSKEFISSKKELFSISTLLSTKRNSLNLRSCLKYY